MIKEKPTPRKIGPEYNPDAKPISLALQGGGAHGAFTWGVLDRLLEEPSLNFTSISGTSAGALNGVAVAYGAYLDGRAGARRILDKLWLRISQIGDFIPLKPTFLDKFLGTSGSMEFSPSYWLFNLSSLAFSPYQLNPLNINPLRTILNDVIDFEATRDCGHLNLYVCATNVRTNRPRVFSLSELTVEVLLASACLPHIFQTVEIDGEAYWDGGFMGNPPIFPLLDESDCSDVMLVKVNPITTNSIPKTAAEIEDRMNEIHSNSCLMWEMRYINKMNELVKLGIIKDPRYRYVRMHAINADRAMANMRYSSKLNTSYPFLKKLKSLGRLHADKWLRENLEFVGVKTSYDIRENFL